VLQGPLSGPAGTSSDGTSATSDSGFVEDKDLSLLRTLTDEELVKACGGRTAHKGGRHGHRMNAKLARIERAEVEYMENHKLKEQEAILVVEQYVSSRLGEGEATVEDANTEVKKKKKKRKREKDGIDAIPDQELRRCDVKDFVNEEEEDQKLKKKKSKKRPFEENIENEEPPHELKVKKKKSKKSKDDSDDSPLEVQLIVLTEEESATKKKKKSKKKKLKGGSD